jgi:hypothetical protein
MSAKSERPKNRRVRLVGGGHKWTRTRADAGGGSAKSQRRKLRQTLKTKKRELTVSERKVIKEEIRKLYAQKDGR